MSVKIIAAPNLFTNEVYHTEAPEGLTLAEMLLGSSGLVDVSYGLHVFINDVKIAQEHLHLVRPKAGTQIIVRAVPYGDSGSGDGKDPLRTILSIAVIAAAIFLPPLLGITGTFLGVSAAGLATSVIGTVGMLAINALIPPRISEETFDNSQGEESPNYSISGARNAARPRAIVPVVLGTHRVVPPLGAETFTELLGADQYIRMLIIWGYGPLDISDLKIGETVIGNFQDVEIETREGRVADAALTLYPNVVGEQSLSIILTNAVGFQSRTTDVDTDEISVDISFQGGLVRFDENGNRTSATVSIEIEKAVTGSGSWSAVTTLTVNAASTQPVRRGHRFTVARDQYDVRLRRTTGDTSDTKLRDIVTWTVLRSFSNEDPDQFEQPLAKTAIRIKATDQLNSVVDQLNALVKSEALDWNGAAWVTALTNNPASLFRLVLQSPANSFPVADANIDLVKLQEWHDFCVTNNFEFNHIRDFSSSVWNTLADIAAAGRAFPTIKDGIWSVLIDEPRSTIIQHFSTRNSKDFKGEKVFDDPPHAWRASFINEDKGYVRDERLIYDDGFTEINATKFEGIEFPGVTNTDQVWKHGRYNIATARLRPETYTFITDFEHIVCTRGDLIRMEHDVPLFGITSGRIKAIQDDSGGPPNATGVTTDEILTMEGGNDYALRFRLDDGTSLVKQVVTNAGENVNVTFTTPYPLTDGPSIGDLFQFGELNTETVELVVKSIEPADDMSAKIVCLDHATAIYNADIGAIPEHESQITLPPFYEARPAQPIIRVIQSDLTVAERAADGVITEKIVITSDPPIVFAESDVFLEAQIRRNGTDNYGPSITQNISDTVTIPDVIGGEEYDIRIRRVTNLGSSRPGQTSDWFEQLMYTVIGKTDLPDDVGVVLLETDRAVWDYEPPLDFAGFKLRFHRGPKNTWADADPAHEGFITETVFNIAHLRGGLFTLLLKAFDTGFRESVNTAILVVDLGDAIVDNVVLLTIYQDFNYGLLNGQATLIGGVEDAGQLKATDATIFWVFGDGGIFWNQLDTDLFWSSVFDEMTYEVSYVPVPSLGGEISLDTTITASTFSLQYRTNGEDILWNASDSTPLWTTDGTLMWGSIPAYRAWPGKIEALRREQIFFKIVTAGGATRGIIDGFTVIQDVPDVIENFGDIELDAGGTRLTLTENFTAVLNVSATLQVGLTDARTIRIVDKSVLLGPQLQALDSAGVGIDATIDAIVQGY